MCIRDRPPPSGSSPLPHPRHHPVPPLETGVRRTPPPTSSLPAGSRRARTQTAGPCPRRKAAVAPPAPTSPPLTAEIQGVSGRRNRSLRSPGHHGPPPRWRTDATTPTVHWEVAL